MEIAARIRRLVEVLKVAKDDVIGNTARILFNLNWKEGLSARNQAHKILDILAETGQIKKGKGFYATNDYDGGYLEHDRLVTQCITQLVLLKLPLTVYREVSFSIGLRSDVVGLLGKNGKAICFVLEVSNRETDAYMAQKVVGWRNFQGANEALGQLFNAPIPHFTLVVYGKTHPELMDFETFIKEVK